MKTKSFKSSQKQYNKLPYINCKKRQIVQLSIILLIFLTSCSKGGIYSIIISNPGIQSESNDNNDLHTPYKKKNLVFPASVVIMSDEEQNRWRDTLNQYNVHTIDTFIKTGMFDIPGLAHLKIPACNKKGVAIIALDSVGIRKRGRIIDVKMRYVCKSDNRDINWSSPSKFWAATSSYKIDVNNSEKECYDGFQSVEFQFIPRKNDPVLRSVLIICANE